MLVRLLMAGFRAVTSVIALVFWVLDALVPNAYHTETHSWTRLVTVAMIRRKSFGGGVKQKGRFRGFILKTDGPV